MNGQVFVDLDVPIAWAEVQVQFAGNEDIGFKSHTTTDYYAEQFEFYYIDKNTLVPWIGGTAIFTDPNGHSHTVSREASYYLETPTVNSFTSEWGEWSDGGDIVRVNNYTKGMAHFGLGGEEYVIDPDWGQTSNPIYGIIYQASVTTPLYVGGTFAYTQLENTLYEDTKSDNTSNYRSTWGHYILDDPMQFSTIHLNANTTHIPNSNQFNSLRYYDSPKVNIDDSFTDVVRYDDFKTYLTYKPDGNDCIWVSLSVFTWYWGGKIHNDGSYLENETNVLMANWNIIPETVVFAKETSHLTSELPTWQLYYNILPENKTWSEITGDAP
jgi:hypothetical protein